jgi:hypothetical protein
MSTVLADSLSFRAFQNVFCSSVRGADAGGGFVLPPPDDCAELSRLALAVAGMASGYTRAAYAAHAVVESSLGRC